MKTNYKFFLIFISLFLSGLSEMKAQSCQANFTWNDSLCLVFFTSTSTGVGPGTSYTWNFGDANYGYAPNEIHSYPASGMYYVCLTIIDSSSGCYNQYCDTVVVNCSSSVQENLNAAGTVSNFPNPFSESTIIHFDIPESGNVRLSVYNLLGEETALILNEKKEKGNYSTGFNASNLSPGMYILQLKLNDKYTEKKINIVK